MLSIQKIQLKNKGSIKQVQSYLEKSTEYYAQENGKILPPAKWFGGLADELNLNDETRDANKDFARLLAGFHPSKKQKLVQNAGSEKRALGFDLTFSAEKSYSIAVATASDDVRKQLLLAHEVATEKALKWVQSELTSRTGKGGKTAITVSGIAVRQVTHIDNRNGEPQLHTHNVLVNVVKCKDGKVRALDANALISARESECLTRTAGAIYRHAMAQECQRLGFGIEREVVADTKKRPMLVSSIAGIDKQTCDEFSSRRKEILQAQKEGEDLNEVANKSRQKKSIDNEPAIVLFNAQKRLDEMRIEKAVTWNNVEELKQRASKDITADFEQMRKDLHATKSHFSRYEMFEVITRYCPLEKDISEFFAEVLEAHDVIRLDNDKYCLQSQYEKEMRIIYDATKRRTDFVALDRNTVNEAISKHQKEQGFELTQEQRQAVAFVTQQPAGLACISGFAGTGKTATAGAYIRAFEMSGYNVIGCSTSQLASEKLADEARIKTFNTSDLLNQLERGKIAFDNKTVLILDEAGMVGANTFHQLQQHIDKAGGKLIAVGDALQLTPIEAGSPFRVVGDEIGDVKQTEIRRQKNEELRKTANDFYGDKTGSELIAGLRKNGSVVVNKTDLLMQAIADNYLSSQQPAHEKLIVAQTNEELNKLASVVRAKMRERGLLSGEEFSLMTEKNEGRFTFKEEKGFAVGDRIKLTKNDKKSGFVNGMVGTITAIEKTDNGLKIELTSDDGSIKTIPEKYKNLTHAYASTVHSAQGQGMNEVHFLNGNTATTRNALLVATTRAKNAFTVYSTQSNLTKLEKSIDSFTQKQNAFEVVKRKDAIRSERMQVELRMKFFKEDCAQMKMTAEKNIEKRISVINNELADIKKLGKEAEGAVVAKSHKQAELTKKHKELQTLEYEFEQCGIFDVSKKKRLKSDIEAETSIFKKIKKEFLDVEEACSEVYVRYNASKEREKDLSETLQLENSKLNDLKFGIFDVVKENAHRYPGGLLAYEKDAEKLQNPKTFQGVVKNICEKRKEHMQRQEQQEQMQREQLQKQEKKERVQKRGYER
ncbi:TPA: MobF family relaxase [Stenotrophomonas maltophilia]